MKRRSRERIAKMLIVLGMTFCILPGAVVALSYFYFARDLPSTESLKDFRFSSPSIVYSDDGEVIAEFFAEKREVVPLDRVPAHLVQAFVAGEDARFFRHGGIDYTAILRALYRNLFSGEIIQGGSTITQQVVKSLLLTPERTFSRKAKEAILAYRIERDLSKEEILFLYLNQIYLGNGAYGVAAASEVYFGKPVQDLSLAESALLAGLPRAPSRNAPSHHPAQARRRQTYVFQRMEEEGPRGPHPDPEPLRGPVDREGALFRRISQEVRGGKIRKGRLDPARPAGLHHDRSQPSESGTGGNGGRSEGYREKTERPSQGDPLPP
jgi:penicillin-binding protein 1A